MIWMTRDTYEVAYYQMIRQHEKLEQKHKE